MTGKYFEKLIPSLLSLTMSLCLVSISSAQSVNITDHLPSTLVPYQGKGRIAISSDGNKHDKDDWGATPSTLAIIAAKGYQDMVIHYDYCDHLGKNDPKMEKQEQKSAIEAAKRFGFNRSLFFNDQTQLEKAITNLTNAINQSTENNPLIMILAGPMEVPYRAIAAADKSKLKYVYCLSHSKWNNNHVNPPLMTHRAKDIQALGEHWVQIPDQNKYLYTKKDWAPWQWLKDSKNKNYKWLYHRMKVEGKPDISDAGMAFYLMTGNDYGKPIDLKHYLEGK